MNAVFNNIFINLSQMVILGAIEEDKLVENCFRGSKKIIVAGTTELATKGGSKVNTICTQSPSQLLD